MAADLDTSRVGQLMTQFEAETKTMIPKDLLERVKKVVVDTMMVENSLMLETMKAVFSDNDGDYCVCPHTAVGVAYHYKHQGSLPQVRLHDIKYLHHLYSPGCVGHCVSRQVS